MATETLPKERTLPHNLDAERTVLGAVLVDDSAFNSAAEVLSREDFYKEGHRRIFEAMASLSERSQPIDLVTLKDELGRQQALEAVGGVAYLAALVDGLPRLTNVEPWSRIIKEKSVLRRLIHASQRIAQTAYEAEEDAANVLDEAERSIFEIADNRIRAGFVGIRDIVKESFRTIDQLSHSKDRVTGVPTGFVDLDERTSGLQKGDLVIVAARPAMGKSSFALNIAHNASAVAGETVGMFSLEMSKEQLVLRLLTGDARVDAHRLRTGALQEKDWARLAKAYADLSASKIFIDDSASITPLEMRAKCRRLKAEHGLGLVIVDYLQLDHARRPRREPPAGDLRHQPLFEGARQGAGAAGGRALAAVARAGSTHRPPAAALRPARVGRHRTGRRRGDDDLPRGGVQGDRREPWHRRDHHRQAAQRPDRCGAPRLRQGIHALRKPAVGRRFVATCR